MSLRLRLLLAVGAIAIVALVVADFATYSALALALQPGRPGAGRSTRNRLPANRRPGCPVPVTAEQLRGRRSRTAPAPAPAPARGRGRGRRLPQHLRDQLRLGRQPERHGRRRSRMSAYVGNHPYRPQLPSDHRVHDAAGRSPGGVLHHRVHRPRWSVFPRPRGEGAGRRNWLVQAAPLGDQNSTLHTLLLTELAVTAGALVLALAGGWWLVRLGLRPLEDVERTADSIAAGDLDQRVPGADQAPRSVAWPVPSTSCSSGFRLPSRPASPRSPGYARTSSICASSWPTPRTSSAPRSPPCRPTPSCSSGEAPSIPMTCRASFGHPHGDRPHGPPGQRPPHPGPAGRGCADGDGARGAGGAGLRRRPHRGRGGAEWPVQFWAAVRSRSPATRIACARSWTTCWPTSGAHPVRDRRHRACRPVGDQARIEVRDTGPGMSDEDARRVFERFFRPTRPGPAPRGGSGLGCPSSPPSWRPTAGPSRPTSTPGHGLVVTVLIPVSPAQQGQTRTVATTPPSRRLTGPACAAPPAIHTGSTAGLHGAPRRAAHHA